ncbi:MAG TPA: 50S ribosomal protein L10 [Candidatus Caccovivens faecavium]|nr:50S ribosomal protein L10 [Candidatus Caccovivens faecavium]
MSANFEAKKQLVEEIKEKFSKAKTLAFVDYRGLNVEEDTAMRKAFRENGCEYKVYKNRLMLKALSDLGIECSANYFEGTTAVAIGYADEVAPAKILCDTIGKTKKMAIKFGILNGVSVSASDIEALSKLPSKEELIAKLLGTLNNPITGLCRVLQAPTRGLAVALNAIATK